MIKIKKIFLNTFIAIIFLSFLMFNFSFSQENQNSLNQLKIKLFKILRNLITFLFQILFLLSSVILVYLGILYILGKSNVGGKDSIHLSILYVIIGIVLLILSFFIPNLIKSFFQS